MVNSVNNSCIQELTNKKLLSYTLSIPRIWLMILASFMQNIITVATPFLMIFMITKLLFITNPITYLEFAIGYSLISLLWLVLALVKDQLFYGMLLKYDNIIQVEAFRLILDLPYSYVHNLPTESQFSRITELENFCNIWLNNIVKPLFELPLVILSFGVICLILGFTYFAAISTIVLAIIFLSFHKRKISNTNKPLPESEYNGTLKDILNNIHLINAHGRAKYFYKKCKELIEKKFTDRYIVETKNEIIGNVIESLLLVIYICTLVFGVYSTLVDHLSVQYLVIVLLLTWFAISPLRSMLVIFDNIPQAKNIINQFTALLNINKTKNRHKKITMESNTFSNIVLQDISFNYGGSNKFILNKINLIANKGQVILINGESGSGKSTLLKILAGLITPTSGLYQIGTDVTMLDKEYLQKEIILLSNNMVFETLSVNENIMLNQYINQEKENPTGKNSHNLHATLNKKLDQATTGKRNTIINKITLAKITGNISDKIILLDEPMISNNADILSRLSSLIGKLKQNNNIVIIASRYNFYSTIVDDIILMHNGSITKKWSKHIEEKLIETKDEK